MSEWVNPGLHPEGSAARRKLERLRVDADHSGHGSDALAIYGEAARAAYLDPEGFERAAASEEPVVEPPDANVGEPAPKAEGTRT